MGQPLILETTFLIDLERETERRADGPASRFLRDRPEDRFCVSFITVGEMAAGIDSVRKDDWEDFFRPLQVLGFSLEVGWAYGGIYRHLAANGQLIGGNDLWIAATALANGMPVVTRNVAHFNRVPGLAVVTY